MKVRLLIPMKMENPQWVEGGDAPRFKWAETGTEIEHKDCAWLVRVGVAEPADDECEKAVASFWNPDSKAFLQADYDQRECAHTTGDSRYDSEHGEPSALERMKKRLNKNGITYDSADNVDVMKKHKEFVKQLKVKANERIRRERPAATHRTAVRDSHD